jgi:hypothetical protein
VGPDRTPEASDETPDLSGVRSEIELSENVQPAQ